MNSGRTRFKKGNQIAKLKIGKLHNRTIIKKNLGLKNLQELEGNLIQGWSELLNSKSKLDRRFALKEISRYVFPVKKEVSHFNNSFEEYLKELREQKDKEISEQIHIYNSNE